MTLTCIYGTTYVKPEAAVKMINTWVKKATGNLIESIISTGDINADTDLVLANAVYFKGDWMEPFQPCGTSTFHLLDGRHTKAEFMSMSYYTLRQVACMDGFKVLKIPYKEAKPDGGCTKPEDEPSVWPHASKASRYSMFVFLPDTRDGMATMVDVVTASPAFMYSIAGCEPEAALVQDNIHLGEPQGDRHSARWV